MKNIINVPVTIIPFPVFKMRVLDYLASQISDAIKNDETDEQFISELTERMKDFLGFHANKEIIDFVKQEIETMFDPIIAKYYEEDAVMVFVEDKGELYSLYRLDEEEVNSYGEKVKTLE